VKDDLFDRSTRDAFLTWSGRINRVYLWKALFVLALVSALVGLFCALAVITAAALLRWGDPSPAIAIVLFALTVLGTILGTSLLVRRAHDLGLPAAAIFAPVLLVLSYSLARELALSFWPEAWSVLVAPPVTTLIGAPAVLLALALYLGPGTKGENRYGPAPSPA
jgi:uncharacterized membrane protein YhaH (DUF805 family)